MAIDLCHYILPSESYRHIVVAVIDKPQVVLVVTLQLVCKQVWEGINLMHLQKDKFDHFLSHGLLRALLVPGLPPGEDLGKEEYHVKISDTNVDQWVVFWKAPESPKVMAMDLCHSVLPSESFRHIVVTVIDKPQVVLVVALQLVCKPVWEGLNLMYLQKVKLFSASWILPHIFAKRFFQNLISSNAF
ncbi:hypothetical protein PIB30_017822 [Stylosanthes scabra]|uniref:Uncharacterized protein n=1 Tax=Stylosanthes scabra TaxID=79078 RepID=A0ABU6V9C7_9FABA|nr:hypothetical protein [Stylosanthes scabra]